MSNETPQSTPAPAESQPEVKVEATEVKSEASSEAPKSEESSSKEPTKDSPKEEAKAEAAAEKLDADKVADDKYEIKVDGEVLTVNKEEMIKLAQMGKAGQKRMQEYAAYQKQVQKDWEVLKQTMKDNPEAVLSDPEIGHDPVELAKRILAKHAEETAKSPEQKELEKYKQELETLRKEREEEMTRKEREEYERNLNNDIQQLETQLLSSLDKFNIPKDNPQFLDEVFNTLMLAQKNDLKVNMDDVVKLVKEETMAKLQSLTNQLSDEELEAFLGDGVVKKIKERTLKKVKAAPKVETIPVAKADNSEDKKEKEKINIKDWMKPF